MFVPKVYKDAAEERMAAARKLATNGEECLASYLAGVAVECIFLAYLLRSRNDNPFAHNLIELYRNSRFAEAVPASDAEVYGEHLSEIAARWRNDLRYRSRSSFRTFLHDQKKDRGLGEPFETRNARIVVDSATKIVDVGVQKWTPS